jgi:hypothetical protein
MLEDFYNNTSETQKSNDIIQKLMDSAEYAEEYNKGHDETFDVDGDEDLNDNKHVDCLNIHQLYFKNLHNRDNDEHMLYDIDVNKQNGTNRSLELFYESLHEYKTKLNSDPEFCDIYDATQLQHNKMDNFTSMFVLKIDGTYYKLSPSIFALITYVAHYIDWKNVNWHIISLK